MYLLGHVGLTILVFWIINRYSSIEIHTNKYLIVIGAMIPDLIDKPIGSLFFQRGRWFGHSIFVYLIGFGALYLVQRRYSGKLTFTKDLYIALSAAIIHLLLDQPSLGIGGMFWPLFGPAEIDSHNAFLFGITDPFTRFTEVVGLITLISVGLLEKWNRKHWVIMVSGVIVYLVLYFVMFTIMVGDIRAYI